MLRLPYITGSGGSVDYSIKIGGEAGQGIQTIGDTMSKVFSRCGYHVFTHQDYMSRVRGGHNFYQIRVSDREISASRGPVDILVAFDRESILLHGGELSEIGLVVYDSAAMKEKYDGPQFFDVPLLDLAMKSGGDKIMVNTVATGTALGMLGLGTDIFLDILRDTLGKKANQFLRPM